jgi:UDP-GlcNAc3NAcA epimerase
MRIVSIIGARPQFVKVAAICRAVPSFPGVEHLLVHTGQHYDVNMSDVFFQELSIPAPDFHLGVGSGSHAVQTGEIMRRLEPILKTLRPDWTVVYGDTNSTAAAALVSRGFGFRTAHVEAGLRSHNRSMPEEINRIVADRLCDLLLCPTAVAVENLEREGLSAQARFTGDVMYDAARNYRGIAEANVNAAPAWPAGGYALATVHRAGNTDDPQRLAAIVDALDAVAAKFCPVVWPLHPRTAKMLCELNLQPKLATTIPPASYLEMLLLESRARFVLTDSGGVQKEAYFFQVPCITLRDETEWVETLENSCNTLAGVDSGAILQAASRASSAGPWTAAYGHGNAAALILGHLLG